jgi:hypothetical protein
MAAVDKTFQTFSIHRPKHFTLPAHTAMKGTNPVRLSHLHRVDKGVCATYRARTLASNLTRAGK